MNAIQYCMNRTARTVTLFALTVGLAGVAGCVERKETIRVAPDGGVTIDLSYKAEPGDLQTPVAFPSAESGWDVQRESEFDKDGKETITLTSRRSFEPREALPSSFAPTGAKDADLYMQFPTTIRVEQRPDGTYMHFRRVYTPRKWAYIQYWHDLAFDGDVKKLGDKNLDELTLDEKAEVLKAFAGFELYKHMELASIAIKKLGDRVPQDAALRARMALTSQYEDIDWKAFVAQFEPESKEPQGAESETADQPEKSDKSFTGKVKQAAHEAFDDHEARERRFEEESHRLLVDSLHSALAELQASANLNEQDLMKLHEEFEKAQKEYDITEALGAHSFKIKVIMPGEIVGYNGDKLDEETGEVTWEFDGNAFRDRSFELAVSSKLDGRTGGR